MAKYTTTNQTYFFQYDVDYEGVNYKIYAPLININSRFIIEYKVPKVDILDESIPETVSILVQITNTNPYEYDIRNVYWRMRNYKAEKIVSKYRKVLDNIVPLIHQ